MKRINIITSICLIVLLFSSCNNLLEVEPKFAKEGSQIFKTLEDYEFALTGAYALFRQTGYFGSGGQTTSTWGNLPDMMADNLVRTGEDLANWQTQTNWSYTADENDLEVAWIAAYSVILQANLVLRNIEQFSSADPKAVNRIKGQALAIRGMVHFDLLRFWGESYDPTSNLLGIPYIEVVDANFKPSRLTVQQSYVKILKDLKDAETLLADIDKPINTSTSRAYIDLIGTRAILARVSLYARNYADAESYASLVINAIGLASRTTFPNIWRDASISEVVWSVSFNLGEGVPSAGVHIAGNNRNRFKPSAALEASYDQINDVRYSSYYASRVLNGISRRIVSKFYARNSAPPTAGDNLVNWKAIRTGEMYLIRAEARALQSGKESLGLDDLNALRSARIQGYTPQILSGQSLLDAIALERRKELCGEGHRWFDLKRTTKVITRTAGDIYIAGTPLNLGSSAREWNWPIPTTEINSNANIKGQQTAGY